MTSESLNMEQKEAGLEKKLKIQSPGAEEAGGNNAQSTRPWMQRKRRKLYSGVNPSAGLQKLEDILRTFACGVAFLWRWCLRSPAETSWGLEGSVKAKAYNGIQWDREPAGENSASSGPCLSST